MATFEKKLLLLACVLVTTQCTRTSTLCTRTLHILTGKCYRSLAGLERKGSTRASAFEFLETETDKL